MMINKQNVIKAAGSLRIPGQETSAEAAVHAVYDNYQNIKNTIYRR